MAIYKKQSKHYFLLGDLKVLAVTTFVVGGDQKLVEYNFPMSQGIDYEDNGDGERRINISGVFMDFENINVLASDSIQVFREAIVAQKALPSIKFVHPEMGAYDVKIKSYEISQHGEKEGYEFTLNMVKVTKHMTVEKKQESVEKIHEATPKAGESYFIVVAGDTLWGKAKQIYGEGMLWRSIWRYGDNAKNSRSKDPNLIYPGEKFYYPLYA
jgi:hypothetical protein